MKHEVNPQESNRAEARSQPSRLATLLKPHLPTNVSRKCAVHPHNILLQESTSEGLLLYVKRVLNGLNCKKLLFTFAKIYLLALKYKQIDK